MDWPPVLAGLTAWGATCAAIAMAALLVGLGRKR